MPKLRETSCKRFNPSEEIPFGKGRIEIQFGAKKIQPSVAHPKHSSVSALQEREKKPVERPGIPKLDLRNPKEIRNPHSSTSNSTRHQTSGKLPENVQAHRRFNSHLLSS
jgi:hypothetical protein